MRKKGTKKVAASGGAKEGVVKSKPQVSVARTAQEDICVVLLVFGNNCNDNMSLGAWDHMWKMHDINLQHPVQIQLLNLSLLHSPQAVDADAGGGGVQDGGKAKRKRTRNGSKPAAESAAS